MNKNFNSDSIPKELKKCNQWILWRLEQRNENVTKVPYCAYGYGASVTDPKTWTSFDEAFETYLKSAGAYSGLGFVLTESDPYIGIDWDHIRDPITGKFEPEIWDEITSLNSYAEISQSVTGAHVIAKGTVPGSRNRKGCREMYSSGRYFAITGNHILDTPLTVNEAPELALKAIYEKIDPTVQKTLSKDKEKKQSVLQGLHLTDQDVIQLCENAANGDKFKDLLYGNWAGKYVSQSEADLALCSLIAFHTSDTEQINRIFKRSGLIRDKWDNNSSYRTLTIEKALNSVADVKEKTGASKQESVLKEPYIVIEDKIYLNVMDMHGNHLFAYLGDDNKIEYVKFVSMEGRVKYPQELPKSRTGKVVDVVGIPLKELLDNTQTVSAEEIYEMIKTHVIKYVDAPQIEIEMFAYYILFTWFYQKQNTTPYLRFIGDTGKGKSRMLNVVGNLCFYPLTVSGSSSTSGIIRFNELWHGTLKVDEADRTGGMESDFIKYLNLGFEKEQWFVKTNPADCTKQEFFNPFGPKVIAMRMPFQDNATEGRLLSFSPRETTNPEIPIILPPAYDKEVEELRALIARFVLFNWTRVDANKEFSCKGMNIEPRLQQLAIPLSIVLQLLPNGEERFRDYILRRQSEVTKIRSESWEGVFFNYVYSLAIGDEKPIAGFEEFFVEKGIAAIAPSMVAQNFSLSAKFVTQKLSSIGITSESKDIMILNKDGELKRKKTRCYTVPNGAAWNEMAKRYLDQGSVEERIGNIPECPDVLKAKTYIE
ncbi:hypothetical protein MSMAT_1976 [Methanosarcina mazei TMA]|uniref:phage NrS-1 polymerase family protein n=1 Tax=Methanosarcina mazei TaxID=2209 RepID=UPI001C3399CB|nr:hypothetical protein [Methanosarcina mazei]UWJ23233.1 hypothetical protein MSMAT_1976 [Methanosarcina mazei TMA]BBL65717.1 hypothetical protein MmazTMA_26940 [Methanosarcina mazei]